ncbi:MAG: RIP metalloprotease RseP [Clostridia bacterium]|nr:RIP metalloprotease RseP [Clostridia bacterium]MCL6520984.1 RIP metalloprotease RseP [Bacillota bacterium]
MVSNWILVVAVFAFLIVFHEFGHYLMGKLSGVRVDEFAVGFGPRLAGFRWGETAYNLRLLPLGGFCRLAGLEAEPDDLAREVVGDGPPRAADEEGEGAARARLRLRPPIPPGRSFQDKSFLWRLAIIAAGPLFNIALAVVLFAVTFTVAGIPSGTTLRIASVQAGLPAAAAGLRPGDRLVAVDGQRLTEWQQFQQVVASSPGRRLELTVERDGRLLTLAVTPQRQADGHGLVGVAPASELRRMSPGQGILQAFGATWSVIAGWFQGIGAMVSHAGGVQVMGPVGIGAEIFQASLLGFSYLLLWGALISANLGLINLLPIPALDGSHLLLILVEWIRGRPVDPAKVNLVQFIGFALLMLLMIAVTYRDLVRLIG